MRFSVVLLLLLASVARGVDGVALAGRAPLVHRVYRVPASPQGHSFTAVSAGFELDGALFTLVSCEMHYFRLARDHWADRIARVRALGCNAVQTYVAWNWHCHTPPSSFGGPVDAACRFDGDRDLAHFLALVQQAGLFVTLRLGPFIDGEWEWGGYPAWMMFVQPGLLLRTDAEPYMSLALQWFDTLLPVVKVRGRSAHRVSQRGGGWATGGSSAAVHSRGKLLAARVCALLSLFSPSSGR
jgi:hypothetical protein